MTQNFHSYRVGTSLVKTYIQYNPDTFFNFYQDSRGCLLSMSVKPKLIDATCSKFDSIQMNHGS